MTPQQVNALEDLLLLVFGMLSIPVSWVYAARRGRRPWVWALLAVFIAWTAALLLMLLPDKSKPTPPSEMTAGNPETEDEAARGRIMAEQNLRDLLGRKSG